MMKLRIIAVGKIKSKPVKDLVGEYASRLVHYFPTERIDAKDEKAAIKMIDKGDHLVVCDENGQQKTSPELANLFSMYERRRIKRVVFFIGGPEGVGAEMKKRADYALALSKMTFPHEMAQAILLEQIYRAATILKGEAYHK